MPLPLTTATKPIGRLEEIAKLRGFDEKWESGKGYIWTHPDDHILQQRNVCMNALRSVSNGNVESFFQNIRTNWREFYIAHIRNALVHPEGLN
jgi:hypothetical protein